MFASSRSNPTSVVQKSPRCAIENAWRPSRSTAARKTGTASLRAKKNPPESFDSGGSSGGAEGTRTPDPLHAMQVRYQLRHSPEFSLLRPRPKPDPFRSSVRISPKQLKYLRPAFPKIPNRAYSVGPGWALLLFGGRTGLGGSVVAELQVHHGAVLPEALQGIEDAVFLVLDVDDDVWSNPAAPTGRRNGLRGGPGSDPA